MATEAGILLTPPPDHSRNSFPDMRCPSRPLDDSSEDDLDSLQKASANHDELMTAMKSKPLVVEDTTNTTTTTTTTTMASKGKLEKLDGFVAHPVHKEEKEPLGASPLSTSTSDDSLTSSRSGSVSPGTPSSTEGLHTISTTSTTTTRKRKVRRPTFEARSSRLDPEALNKNQDPFRGFHTLFWIVMGAYGLITFDEEWTRVGKAFGGTLFSSFSQDAIMLAVSDAGLVLSTGIAFLLIKTVAKGWLRYRVTGMVIQHCVQVLFLLLAIVWTIWR